MSSCFLFFLDLIKVGVIMEYSKEMHEGKTLTSVNRLKTLGTVCIHCLRLG